MELRHVEYFVAVAEELSFTRAAQRLLVAQSAVSAQVKKLEQELEVTLFHRTTRSVELTEAGRVLLDQARPLLRSSKQAAESTRLAHEGKLGRLTLGFVGTATYGLMPALVKAYHQRFPDVALEVRSGMLTPAQIEGLLDGELSVGLLRPPVSDSGIVVEVVRDEPLVALVPMAHPAASHIRIDLADLRNEIFISYPSDPPSSVYRAMMSACQRVGFTPTIGHQTSQTATLVAMVAAGLGVALAPATVRHLGVNGVTHRPLATPRTSVPLAIAYRGEPVSALVRGYIETARQVMRRQRPLPGPPTGTGGELPSRPESI